MSRVANSPVALPSGVEVKLDGQHLTVKGVKGAQSLLINSAVALVQEDKVLKVASRKAHDKQGLTLAGTTRSLINNMVIGVSQGFEKKLLLNGVGYRAKASGKTLNLVLGFSHDVDYKLPEGVKAETPSQTEVVLTASDKQLLGQVASEIRALRPPEPYKGKGVCYSDEYIRRKEAKKK